LHDASGGFVLTVMENQAAAANPAQIQAWFSMTVIKLLRRGFRFPRERCSSLAETGDLPPMPHFCESMSVANRTPIR
jgi:hypothetical protein